MAEQIDNVNFKQICSRTKIIAKSDLVANTSVTNITKIIHHYFKICTREVLKGGTWVFPNDFGTLSIIRVESPVKGFKKFNKKKYFEEGKSEMCFNPKTVGYYCKYNFNSEVLRRSGMRFMPSVGLRKTLRDLLLTKDNNFRYE